MRGSDGGRVTSGRSEWGVAIQRPSIVPHRPEWEHRAAALVQELRERLGPLALRIDHIGSTAIPLMPSKEVIDLQVGVLSLARAAAAFDSPLFTLGFVRSPYEMDHTPAGRSSVRGEWAKRLWVRRGHPDVDANLHVRRVGSPNERLALLFRDWFCAHPSAVPAYGLFKERLVGVTTDVDTYADVKDPVVDLVMVAAEQWAAANGWQP